MQLDRQVELYIIRKLLNSATKSSKKLKKKPWQLWVINGPIDQPYASFDQYDETFDISLSNCEL